MASVADALAKTLGIVGRLSGFTQTATELSKENQYLEELGDWFRAHCSGNAVKVLVYSESLLTRGVMVVDNHSANPGIPGVRSIPMQLDHQGLAGPRQRNDQIFDGVITFARSAISKKISLQSDKILDLAMQVGLVAKEGPLSDQEDITALAYHLKRDGSALSVCPQMGYIDIFRNGGPIRPLNYIAARRRPFLWDYPELDLKFVNNSQKTLFLSEIILEVEESRTTCQPLFAIQRDVQQRFAGILKLCNESWTTLRDLELNFAITPGMIEDIVSPPPPDQYNMTPGDLVDRLDIDVSPALGLAGLDLEKLELLEGGRWLETGMFELPASSNSDGNVLQLAKDQLAKQLDAAYGPFQDRIATFTGEVAFSPETKGSPRRSVKFQTFVYLENANRVGIARGPSSQYQVILESNATLYQRSVPISNELKGSEAEQFTLKVAVAQSSAHRFRIIVKDISGHELQSGWISLDCFVPRMGHKDLPQLRIG